MREFKLVYVAYCSVQAEFKLRDNKILGFGLLKSGNGLSWNLSEVDFSRYNFLVGLKHTD